MELNKVNIKLMGGLGNYMFQIAVAYAYSLETNKEMILTYGNSLTVHKNITSYFDNIFHNIKMLPDYDLKNFLVYNEPYFHYMGIPKIDTSIHLNGYFQSEKYFKNYENDIKKIFSYPQNYILEIKKKYSDILNQKNCSLHVRRGDYLKSPAHHPTQDIEYYKKSIEIIGNDKLFVVFSDDIDWCKNNLSQLSDKMVFISNNPDYEDLLLMSLCNDNIICNSTFSWWSAWLNSNKDKKIIAPIKWFGPAYNGYILSDLYCENWIKI